MDSAKGLSEKMGRGVRLQCDQQRMGELIPLCSHPQRCLRFVVEKREVERKSYLFQAL